MEENAPDKPTVRSVGIKYGLISTAVSIVFFLALVFTGQNAFDNTWNWIGLIFSIVILVLAHKNFKDAGDGFMSYGQGIGIAMWIALVSTVIAGLFTYMYAEVLDPSTMDLFYEKQREGMEASNMPDEQIEVAVTWTKRLFWPLYGFFGLFFSLIVALIVSIFTQKKLPESNY